MTMAGELELEALRFGSYRVIKEIGRGGVARVYQAEHERLGRSVAVKAIDVRRGTSAAKVRQLAARLLREGRTAARLRHPHIVDVLDIGEEQGVPFLVMELISGGTLATLLEQRGKLSVPEVVALLLPLVDAVAHSHRHGVVHRDLKPENVLLDRTADGTLSPKLCDFGVCRSVERTQSEQLTQDGGLVGTLTYMAPEQLRAPRHAGPAADQYALGAILYRASTGALPLRATDPVLLMQQIASGNITSPRDADPTLPEGFAALVLRALARDPGARFPSVLALGQALLPFASGRAWSAWVGKLDVNAAGESASADSGVVRVASTTYDDSHDSVDALPQPPPGLPRARRADADRHPRAWAAWGTTAVVVAMAAFLFVRERAYSVESAAARSKPRVEHPLAVAPVPQSRPSAAPPSLSAAAPTETARAPRLRVANGASVRRAQAMASETKSLPIEPLRETTAPRVEIGRNGAPILQ